MIFNLTSAIQALEPATIGAVLITGFSGLAFLILALTGGDPK